METIGRVVLRRFLKERLGAFLATDLDLAQLSLSLKNGSVELKECLLDVDYLNEQLGERSLFEVESALVGKINVFVSPPIITLQDAVVNIRQRLAGDAPPPAFTSGAPEAPGDGESAQEESWTGVGEGVRQIAGVLQSYFRKIKVEVRNLLVTARTAEGLVLRINLDSAVVNEAPGAAEGWDMARCCSFAGLAAQLVAGDEVVGSLSWGDCECNGEVLVGWRQGDDDITVDVRATIDGAAVTISPTALPALAAAWASLPVPPPPARPASAAGGAHPLSSSMMLTDPASAENIIRALRLPDAAEAEHLVEEELAHLQADHPGEDVDEFFDAVSDLMAQSFFSTASSIFFSDAEHGPAQSFFGAEAEEGQKEEGGIEKRPSRHRTLKLSVGIPALDLWVACPAGMVASEPWYLRVSLQELNTKKDGLHLSTSLGLIEISEYSASDALGNDLRNVDSCRALAQSISQFAYSATGASFEFFHERPPFAETIERLERLKRMKASWSLPQSHEMKPVAAISGPGKLAFALAYATAPEPCATVLMQDIHVWCDTPLLMRLQRLAARIPGSRRGDSSESHTALPLQLFASSCSLSLCLLGNSAVTLAVAPGAALGNLFTDFDKPAFLADDSPFCSVRGNSIAVNAKQARVLHVRGMSPSSPQEFDLADIGVASDLQASALLNSAVNLADFCSALPSALASIDEIGAYGNEWLGVMDVRIAGSVGVYVSKESLTLFKDIGASLSSFAGPTVRSGGAKISLSRLELLLQGPDDQCLQLETSGIHMLHILDHRRSLLAGFLESFSLKNGDIALIDTLPFSSSPVFTMTLSGNDSLEDSEPEEKKTLSLHIQGVSLDNLETLPLVGDKISHLLADGAASEPTAPSQTLSPMMTAIINGSDILALHSASSASGASLQAAMWLSEISARHPGAVLEARALKSRFYLREGKAVDVSVPTASMASWLDDSGFAFVASEEELRLSLTRTGVAEEIQVGAQSLHVSLSKDTAVLLRTLFASRSSDQVESGPARSNDTQRQEEEFYEEEFAPDRMQEALLLDIRGQDDNDIRGQDDNAEKDEWQDGTSLSSLAASLYARGTGMNADPDGHGVWTSETDLANHLIVDYVQELNNFDIEGGINYARKIVCQFDSIHISLADTLYAPGLDVLEGSLELKLESFEAIIISQDPEHVSKRSSCFLKRLHMRHDIHPPQAGSEWHDVLMSPYVQTGPFAFQCVIESDPAGANLRLKTACAPLYIGLDQYCIAFLKEFSNFVNLDAWHFVDEEEEENADFSQLLVAPQLTSIRAHVVGFPVSVSYRPSRFDANALRKGSLVEAANLLPRWKATLWLRELKLGGVDDFSALGLSLGARWLEDVLACQRHKFFISLPGVSTVCRLGSAALDIAALPKETASNKHLKQWLKRAFLRFCSVLASEGRAMGRQISKSATALHSSR